MGFSEAVRWWEEWQLRILVLTSLFLQCFLAFAGILRKRCIPSWLRFLIWLAYLSSDAVAIYGLATLFNRQRTQEWVSTHESSARLQALWASFLLLHLGGQDSITAYNIEDNELWRRHVLTAVSQVAVALYVFRTSLPQGSRGISTGVMLFLAGIVKCVFKPWDLKRVSINSLVDSSAGPEENPGVSSFDEYIRAATENFRVGHGDGGEQPGTTDHVDVENKRWKPYDLFVDLAPPYSVRLSCLKTMVHTNPDEAHRLVRYGLSVTFDRLYTKDSLVYYNKPLSPLDASSTKTSLLGSISFLRFLVTMSVCLLITIPFRRISFSQRKAYDLIDLKITHILIYFTLVLDYIIPVAIYCIQIFREIGKEGFPKIGKEGRWPDEVAQYNLMWYLVRNKKHRNLRRLATLLVCKDYIDQLWCMKPSKSSREITKLVHGYIAQAWMEHHIKDMATFRAFNDNRGQWTIKQEGCNGSLDWGLRRPFDESVLLWHLATDFCFLHMDPSPANTAAYEAARHSNEISNYMVYLLFVNPEMLIPGARRSLFRAMYKQLKGIPLYNDGETAPQGKKELAQHIIHRLMGADQGQGMDRMVRDAWTIANELLTGFQSDEEKMWRVVQGVWVEMLCFSAGRCRGYLHAKNLGKGGEFLSYVWLLLFYMGMETLAEKMQRSETDDGGSVFNTSSASQSQVTATATATEEKMFDKGKGTYDISIETN